MEPVTCNTFSAWDSVVSALRSGKTVFYTDSGGTLTARSYDVPDGIVVKLGEVTGSDRTAFLSGYGGAIQVSSFS